MTNNDNPNKNLKPGTRSPSHETLRRKCSSNMEDDESATNRWRHRLKYTAGQQENGEQMETQLGQSDHLSNH